ncbi:hypothetical protein EXIGLDRAFT_727022 [Exidia glandulosa HHB12029]|uniref:Uncharacterized protein n=1 Tax=Exidia glandulosa HHB12029 TaxID=1314781 RepID=A0A165DHC8_EXIGL|nr:hypothetical protein EXIGLDRAFT_727022 [Exidia glandulosa HHB12029]
MLLRRALSLISTTALFVGAAPSLRHDESVVDILERKLAPEADLPVHLSVNEQVYPPPVQVAGQTIPGNLKVSCKECSISGDFIFSEGNEGVILDTHPGLNVTNDFVNKTKFDFTDQWLAMVLHDFKVHIELEIDLTPSNDSNELDIHLLGKPEIFPIPEIPGLTVTIDPQLHGWINVSKPVSFTYGLDIVVPTGSTLLVDVPHPSRSIAPGFNETTVTPTNFQSSTGDIEMVIEFSFRPEITLGYAQIITAGAFVDLPKLGVQVSQVQNVDAKCAPAAPGASVDDSDVFQNLTKLEPKVGMDFVLTALGDEFTLLDFDNLLADKLPVGCFEYDPKTKTMVPPGSLRVAATHDGKGAGNNAGTRRGRSVLMAGIVLISTLVFLL